MEKRLALLAVFILLSLACVVQSLYYFPQLPEKVARHYDAAGQADAWGDKSDQLNFQLKTIAFLSGTILLVGLSISKVPDSVINLPHRDYWLSSERRQNTKKCISSVLFGFGSITMLLFFDLYNQSIQVNLGHAAKLSHIWISLGTYVTITITGCLVIYIKLNKKPT